MPHIRYEDWNPRGRSTELLTHVIAIVDEYTALGFNLTLRQLYYQLVSRDIIPNTQKSYNSIGTLVSNARMAGMLDWDAIEDRTRRFITNNHWDNPNDILRGCASQYAIDKWADQKIRPEIYIEKEALAGVFESVCHELDVLFFACRGYTSQSTLWRAGRRVERYNDAGQKVVILHFGDHDPSGIDMTRDVEERVAIFASLLDTSHVEERRLDGYPDFSDNLEIRRIALNMDQIQQYNPPPNPAKMSDSRAQSYIAEFGMSSWELDALDPLTLQALVRTEVLALRDDTIWDAAVGREDESKASLRLMSENYDEVSEWVEENYGEDV